MIVVLKFIFGWPGSGEYYPMTLSVTDVSGKAETESPECREEYRKQVELLIKKVKANRERFFRW